MTMEAGAAVASNQLPLAQVAVSAFRRGLRDRRVAFLLAGGLNTLFGFLCFAAYQVMLGHATGYMVVLLLSHVTSVMFAFTVHRKLVFRVSGHFWGDLWRFESVNLTSLALNAALLPALVEGLGLHVVVAQGIVTVVIALVSWVGHSRISFHRGEGRAS